MSDCDGSEKFFDGLRDPRQNAILVGPGLGLGAYTRRYVEAALATGPAVVLDVDALTMFDVIFEELAFRICGPLVISPHDGEFARLFPDLLNLGKLERVKVLAERLGGVVVLKGADTVIAEPGGNALINDNAPPWLATGGTGQRQPAPASACWPKTFRNISLGRSRGSVRKRRSGWPGTIDLPIECGLLDFMLSGRRLTYLYWQ